MRLHLLLLALAAAVVPASAQTYFPLGDGDRWEYGTIVDPPNAAPDTTRFDPVTVADRVSVDGLDYAVVDLVLMPDTVRVDDLGRVWAREGGRDQLFLDVTRGDGEAYVYLWEGHEAVITVRRPERVTVPAGAFSDVIEFAFDAPFVNDDERSITLARGVGMIAAYGAWEWAVLFSAEIDGGRVTAGERAPERLAARAAPNPFRSRVTVDLPPGAWARATVVDALGRRVATLDVPPCAAGCALAWDAGEAPVGLYVVRAEGASRAVSVPVVRGR